MLAFNSSYSDLFTSYNAFFQGPDAGLGSLSDVDDLETTFSKVNFHEMLIQFRF